ncbi:hypothetical protein LBMAG56_43540 [Verrucomicrobiota bacterium]|nr:hypothetical protein LBMAG56_43540 [Verrucomicrobiota bacterium]
MRAQFSDFQKPGMVSVWVGDFRTEGDLDDYLNGKFESDFGFALYERAVEEIGVEPEPVSVEQLVAPFSRSQTFASGVVQAAHSVGRTSASAMFIIYFFAFDPSRVHVHPQAQLSFVGAVPFSGFA